MSTNDLSKDSSYMYDFMTLSTQFPQYMGQLSKSCNQSSPSSTTITGYSQNNIYQTPLLSSMTPAQQQIFQKSIPNSMHFCNSRNFINVTNGGNLMNLSTNTSGKNATTDFVTGGTTTVMSDNYRQLPATDIFCQDYASLPAVITGISSVHDNSEVVNRVDSRKNILELDPQTGDASSNHHSNDPNILRGFSEPCLFNVAASEVRNDSTPNCLNHDKLENVPSTSASNVEASTNKLFSMIMEHIQQLHDTNSKICRNLHETKVDIEALKYTPNWNLRHRRDSISGLSTHSQPVMFGGGFSTQSSTSPYSGAYNPGMMTDIVREVKDAARVREDALLNRVKSLVEERQWSLNEYHLKIMRDLEDIKTQLSNMYLEKKESNKRILHLEDENRQIWQLLATLCRNHNASNVQQIVDEHLNARLQRKPSLGQSSSTMHLKYNEFKEGGNCTKCASPNSTMTPSYSSNAINRHFRTSGTKNNGYAVTGTSSLNSAMISSPVSDSTDIPLISANMAMSGGCGLPIKGPRPSSSHEGQSLTANHNLITEITPPSNDNENRAIVLENLVGMLQVQSSNRRPLNSTCHETTPQQFINSEGHINISSSSFKHFSSPSTTISTPSSFKRNYGFARENDGASLTHSNSILFNNNCNPQKNIIKMTSAPINNIMHNNSGVQNKLSIAGPITDL